MLHFKTRILLPVSAAIAISLPLFISSACSSDNDEMPQPVAEIDETVYSSNDTIYIDGEISDMHKSDMSAVSSQLKDFIADKITPASRAMSELDVYSFYDENTEKSGYAIAHPSKPNTWIYECQSNSSDTSIIMIFEETSANEFVIKDENGEVLRTFTYDPEARELWTFNSQDPTSRAFSSRSFLCNTAFTAAAFLVCEALAVPSGGATLAVGLGFVVASSYLC